MKLQVNTKGSWRDVIDFAAEDSERVEIVVAALWVASGHMGFRVLDDDGTARFLRENGTFVPLRMAP